MFRIFSSLIDSFFGEAKPETPPEAKTTPPSVQPKMHTGLANANPNAAKEELDDANEAEIACFGQIPHHNTDPDQSNRYPMRESPIPCAGINYVLRTQAELIQKIKVAVPLNEPDKDRFLFPVIRNIAAYVHLLPASNNYHHKGRGGLLRHSLEVGLYTVNMGRMHIFDQKADPEAKYRNKGRWFLACFIAGALHDIGKVLVSLTVCGQDGTPVWHPASSSLHDWIKENHLTRYYLTWRSASVDYSQHESAGAILFAQIVPQLTRQFLEEANSATLMNELYDALGGVKRKGALLTNLVTKADQLSTSRDLKLQNAASLVSNGVDMPIANVLLDVIVSLVEDGSWRINEYKSGCLPSALWETSAGTFIVWESAVQSVVNRLNQRNIQGIPRDSMIIAEKLSESGICRFAENAGDDRFWKISPITVAEADLSANGTKPIQEPAADAPAYAYKFFSALKVQIPGRLFEHTAAPEKVPTAVLGQPLADLLTLAWEDKLKRKVPDSGPAEDFGSPEEEAEADRIAQSQEIYDYFDEFGNPVISIPQPEIDAALETLSDKAPETIAPTNDPVVVPEKREAVAQPQAADIAKDIDLDVESSDFDPDSLDVDVVVKAYDEAEELDAELPEPEEIPDPDSQPESVAPSPVSAEAFAPSVFRETTNDKVMTVERQEVPAVAHASAATFAPSCAYGEPISGKQKETKAAIAPSPALPEEKSDKNRTENALQPTDFEEKTVKIAPEQFFPATPCPLVQEDEISISKVKVECTQPVVVEQPEETQPQNSVADFLPEAAQSKPKNKLMTVKPKTETKDKVKKAEEKLVESAGKVTEIPVSPKQNQPVEPNKGETKTFVSLPQKEPALEPSSEVKVETVKAASPSISNTSAAADSQPAEGNKYEAELKRSIEVAGRRFTVQTILERAARNLTVQMGAGGGKLAQHVTRRNGKVACPALSVQLFLDNLKIPFEVFADQCNRGAYGALTFNRALQSFEISENQLS